METAMSSRMVRTPGAAIRIAEGGTGEPALIFLHYWGGSARTWHSVIDRLGGTIHSVAVELRGWGESRATDERYDLDAMADDVEAVVAALNLRRYVLVGHSMGGKVAQILAKRCPGGLAGLILVAPAPPTPMPVPAAQRAGMLASYGSREGVIGALSVLAGSPLSEELREQVIADTLSGVPEAKRAWTDQGMIEDVSIGLERIAVPVSIIVGDHDRVENEPALREVFGKFVPHATFRTLKGVGHLPPLEAPGELADACVDMLTKVRLSPG